MVLCEKNRRLDGVRLVVSCLRKNESSSSNRWVRAARQEIDSFAFELPVFSALDQLVLVVPDGVKSNGKDEKGRLC